MDFSSIGGTEVAPAPNAGQASSGPIDFSSIGGQQVVPPPQSQGSFLNAAKNVAAIGGNVLGQVSSMAPWNKVSQVFPYVAGKEAEMYGRMGVPPFVAASLTTPLAMAPAIAGTALGWQGIQDSPSATVQGLVKTPQELGPQYAAQNEAMGIQAGPLKQSGTASVYPPAEMQGLATRPPRPVVPAQPLPSTVAMRYPRDPGSLVQEATNRVNQFGTQLSPQTLWDYKTLLDQNIGDMSKIPQFIQGKPNPLYAQASNIRSTISDLLNQVAGQKLPGANLPPDVFQTRPDLNYAYGLAKQQAQIIPTLQRYGKTTGEVAGVAGGALAGLGWLYNKLKGGQ